MMTIPWLLVAPEIITGASALGTSGLGAATLASKATPGMGMPDGRDPRKTVVVDTCIGPSL